MHATKGGLSFIRTKAAPRLTPVRANYSWEPGAPLPGRKTRSDRPGRPARPRPGRGRPDGGAPGSRSKVLYVPAAASPGGSRGSGSRRPVRSKVFQVPVATPFDSGLPAHRGCVAGCDVHFWRSRTNVRQIDGLRGDRRGASRSGAGRHRENWPEVGPVLPVGAPSGPRPLYRTAMGVWRSRRPRAFSQSTIRDLAPLRGAVPV